MSFDFGRGALAQWFLDPDFCHLNHGTVGATPKRVLAKQRAWQDRIERNPASFMLRDLVPLVGNASESLIRTAAAEVAAFVGSSVNTFGFTRNVTSAINAVLRSMVFTSGDEVVVFTDTYGAVTIGVQVIVERAGGRVVLAHVENPHDTQAWHDALSGALTDRTRLVILDHITSGSAAVLDLPPLIAQCHERGAQVLIDGAHAPGAIALNITALNCDYYAGNLHKWMWTPRSCGFLAVRPDRAQDTHASILSWGYGTGLTHELDWEGTYDATPMLSTSEALAMFSELQFQRIRIYNHALAWHAYESLSALSPQPYRAHQASIGTMASFFLPEKFGSTLEDAKRVREWLWSKHSIELHTSAARSRVLARISAQVYVGEEDIKKLATALLA
jgi:isopenicillin-N epimerase